MQGERLYQQVAKELLTAINAGEYPTGTRLPAERKLAERFDVSRPTIREAIIALELAGSVEVKGGSGVYIKAQGDINYTMADEDIGPFEILEARIMFESEAAALAARHMTDDELAELEITLQEMIAENARDSKTEIADQKFHLLIAKGTHNDAIVSVCEHLWGLRNSSQVSVRILEKVRDKGSKPRISEHKDILDALKSRKPEKARATMQEHLSRVVKQLLDATEAEVIEAARKKVEKDRERFLQVNR